MYCRSLSRDSSSTCPQVLGACVLQDDAGSLANLTKTYVLQYGATSGRRAGDSVSCPERIIDRFEPAVFTVAGEERHTVFAIGRHSPYEKTSEAHGVRSNAFTMDGMSLSVALDRVLNPAESLFPLHLLRGGRAPVDLYGMGSVLFSGLDTGYGFSNRPLLMHVAMEHSVEVPIFSCALRARDADAYMQAMCLQSGLEALRVHSLRRSLVVGSIQSSYLGSVGVVHDTGLPVLARALGFSLGAGTAHSTVQQYSFHSADVGGTLVQQMYGVTPDEGYRVAQERRVNGVFSGWFFFFPVLGLNVFRFVNYLFVCTKC